MVEVRDPAGRFVGGSFRVSGRGPHRLELAKGVQFRLRVLGEEDTPLEGSRITAWVQGPRVLEMSPLGGDRWGALPDGPAKLVVTAEGHRAAILDVEIDAGTKREPNFRDVRLLDGGLALRGRVAADDRLFPRRALLRWGGAGQVVQVAEDGSFEFRGLPPEGLTRAMLALLRGEREVWTGDIPPADRDVDLGTIEIR